MSATLPEQSICITLNQHSNEAIQLHFSYIKFNDEVIGSNRLQF